MLCEDCKYAKRGHPQWAAHFKSCHHPNVQRLDEAKIFGLVYSKGAVENGWFDWPFNYDPVWIEECKGYIKE